MGGKHLTDVEFGREVIAFFGVKTAAAVLGWAAITGFLVAGEREPNARTILERGAGSPTTRYRMAQRLTAFAAHLREQGYDLDGPEWTDDRTREVVSLFGGEYRVQFHQAGPGH